MMVDYEKYEKNEQIDPNLKARLLGTLNSAWHKIIRYEKLGLKGLASEERCFFNGVKSTIMAFGYMPEYDIIGHRGEWCFPTVAEMEIQEDWIYDKQYDFDGDHE